MNSAQPKYTLLVEIDDASRRSDQDVDAGCKLVALLVMLAGLRMTAWLATLVAGGITLALGVGVWGAPLSLVGRAYMYGGLQGVWAVDWITFWGLMIFNTLGVTGDFERFKNWMVHHATGDVRIQTLMLAWAFGALLEGLQALLQVAHLGVERVVARLEPAVGLALGGELPVQVPHPRPAALADPERVLERDQDRDERVGEGFQPIW